MLASAAGPSTDRMTAEEHERLRGLVLVAQDDPSLPTFGRQMKGQLLFFGVTAVAGAAFGWLTDAPVGGALLGAGVGGVGAAATSGLAVLRVVRDAEEPIERRFGKPYPALVSAGGLGLVGITCLGALAWRAVT